MTGRFLLTPELFVDLLSLPAGTKVRTVTLSDDGRYLEVTVDHESIRTSNLLPRFSRDRKGTMQFVSWGERA